MESDSPQQDYWASWQSPAADDPRWKAEATDLVRRLDALLPLSPEWQVLDYGCGQGLVGARLSRKVARVDLWDISPVARKLARNVCNDLPNVRVLEGLPGRATYDFILVSSVTQYMSEADLKDALAAWKRALKPDGRILVTDIIAPPRRVLAEIGALLRFAARYNLLGHMVRSGLQDLPSYFRNSRKIPLAQYAPEKFADIASRAGLASRPVSNPNLFPSRFAVELRPR